MASVLPGAVAAFLLIGYSYDRHRDSVQEHTLATARALVQAVDRDLASSRTALQALATSPYLAAGDLRAFHAEAREALVELAGNNIVLSDASGQQLLNTFRPFGEPLPLDKLAQLRRVFETGQPAVSDLFQGRVAQRDLIAIAVPVRRNGEVVYVLSMGFLPDRLRDILKQQHLPQEWVAGVFDSQGTTVARTHQPEVYIGKKAGPVLVAKMAEQRDGEFKADTQEGIPTYTVFSRSIVSNWTVAIGIPRAEFDSQLRSSFLWLVGGTLVLLASSILLARLLAARIRTAISGLIPPAEALARGEAVTVAPLQLVEADEVARALERASSVLRDREEILAVVTHDLRSPLNLLTMLAVATEQDARKLNANRLRTSAALMRETALSMSGLVDDLLAITAAQRGQSMLKLVRVNAADVLARAVRAARPRIEQAGLQLEMRAPHSLPEIQVDVDRVLRVFANLLDNALKFSDAHGRVLVMAEALPQSVRFSIANSGSCLPRQQLDKMFLRFWQAQSDRRGAGLGLSICRAIIDTHGGRIWAQSLEGMRVCICFELPSQPALQFERQPAEPQSA